jgi:hypothetical protein
MCYREAPVPSAYMSDSLAWGNWNLWDAKSYQQVRMPISLPAHLRTWLVPAGVLCHVCQSLQQHHDSTLNCTSATT